MERTVVLKDMSLVRIRPIAPRDAERSHAFFCGLPEEERTYLRRDVTRRGITDQRIAETSSPLIDRIVALHDDSIVADGSLERGQHQWEEHVGEIRLIVAPEFRGKGLGMRMARELYFLAHEHDVARIKIRIMRPQREAARIFEKLGFWEEYVFPQHVRDQKGNLQDLVVLRCDLAVLTEEVHRTLPD